MSSVIANLAMSLDGFVADPSDDPGPVFDWYGNGDVEVDWPGNEMVSHTSAASAAYLHELIVRSGALVVGRRLFDLTSGWDGSHPVGVPVFVVSHSVPAGWPRVDAPFTFVTDGVESAVARARAVAIENDVSVAGPNVVQQCLNAGLLDEVRVELVPVLLGRGIRFFDNVERPPVMLDGPTVIEGDRVTHLGYRVRR